MKTNNKLNEGIRLAKEGIEECWDDMEGQEMTSDGNGEQMSVTISMPGKNISVTTDSADEIGNILRLAGITLGGEAPMGDVDGDGDHDITDHAAEIGATEPEVMYVGANSGEMSNSGDVADMSNSGEDEQEEKIADEAVGDTSRTSKGGTVTQTPTGQVHKAGPGNYGGSEEDHEDDTPVPAGAVPEKEEEDEEVKESGYVNEASGIMISGKEVDRASLQVDGVDSRDYPDFSDAYISQASFTDGTDLSEDEMDELNDQHGELVNELAFDSLHESSGESARILQLAGVTNEAQSAAQKAAFAKMIAAKGGKKSDDKAEKKDDNKKPDDDGDGIPDWADKDKEVKEDAPANNIYGQGVYEGKTPKQYWNRDSQSIGPTPDAGLRYADPDEDGVHYPDYANTKDKNSRKFRVKDDDGVETTDSRYRVDPKTKKLKLQHRISIEKESVNQGVAALAKAGKEGKEDAPANNIYGQGVYEGQQEYSRILALAGIAESKLANSPEGTSMPEPKLFDNLPSARGEAAGRKDFGANRASGQGENPMGDGTHTVTVEEQFETAMGEYRKFVSENIARKK